MDKPVDREIFVMFQNIRDIPPFVLRATDSSLGSRHISKYSKLLVTEQDNSETAYTFVDCSYGKEYVVNRVQALQAHEIRYLSGSYDADIINYVSTRLRWEV